MGLDVKVGLDAQGPGEFEFDSSGFDNALNGERTHIMRGEFLSLS